MLGGGLSPAVHNGPATRPDPTGLNADKIAGVDRILEPASTHLGIDDRPVGQLAEEVVLVAEDIREVVPSIDPTHLDVGVGCHDEPPMIELPHKS